MGKLIGLLLVLGCGSVQAIPVRWTINDGVFQWGGVLEGTFTYDAATNIFSDVNITSSGGGYIDPVSGEQVFPGASYSYLYSWPSEASYQPPENTMYVLGSTGACLEGELPGDPVICQPPILRLRFSSYLTNAGGTVNIGYDENNDWYTTEGAPKHGEQRALISGSVSAVPIPAAVYLFGSGLALLGWMRRLKLVN